jgi:esterase
MFLDQFNYSILGHQEENRVVFIHGLMAFSANWRKIASRIQDDFQCLIYDQRGHGRSFKPDSGYSPEDYAEDLNKITNELGWTQFHLVGHSMGGRNALVFADLYPEKLRSLVIEDTGPDSNPNAAKYYEDMLNSIPTPFLSKDEMKLYFKNIFELEFKSKEPISILSSFLQANIETISEGPEQGLFDWRFSKKAILETVKEGHVKDRWNEISNLSMPTLLIRGENSHILKKEVYDKMLQSNPLIQGLEIKQAGHWIHYEKYEEFTTELREFLGKN